MCGEAVEQSLEERSVLGGAEEELFLSSLEGQDEVWWTPQSPDSFLLEETEPRLWVESERRLGAESHCLWAKSRVLSAASIFLSNIFLVS